MKELQSSIGAANWLREYVPEFAHISAPLTDLLGKRKFCWTSEAEEAFQQLKMALGQPLQLSRPVPDLPFTLQTDASSRGMGAVLYQTTPDGEQRIVSCASAKFSKTESKYHCNEQEVLAVVWACKRYRALLEDRLFTLQTDSRALQWLGKYKDDRAKLTRWALLLQEYNFQVKHCPGKTNQLPDLLSRQPQADEDDHQIDEDRILPPEPIQISNYPAEPTIITVNTTRCKPRRSSTLQSRTRKGKKRSMVPRTFVRPIQLNQVEVANQNLTLYDEIVDAQRQSVEYQATRARWRRLRNGEEQATHRWLRTLRDEYTVESELIWYTKNGQRALVVPLNYWTRVLYCYHDSFSAGHPGRDETTAAISRLYYWPAMKRQIETYVRNCLICASTKRGGALQPTAPLRPHPPVRPWQAISLDVMGPYPLSRSSNRFIVVATDLFSKWIEAKAVSQAKARDIVHFLEELCQRWGYPEVTITDNGPPFRSATWERFHRRRNIQSYITPIYHQRSNPVERRNQELKKLLRVHQQTKPESRWDEALGEILFTLRNRNNAATGMTPSEALLGAQLPRPGEWRHPQVNLEVNNRQDEREGRIGKVRAQQEAYARKLFPEPRIAPVHFRVGEQVLVRSFPGVQTAFGVSWSGPYPILAICGDNTYEVDRNGSQFIIHVDDLRPAPGLTPLPDLPEVDPFNQLPPESPLRQCQPEYPPQPNEPQPGASSRPPDPAEFVQFANRSSLSRT